MWAHAGFLLRLVMVVRSILMQVTKSICFKSERSTFSGAETALEVVSKNLTAVDVYYLKRTTLADVSKKVSVSKQQKQSRPAADHS